MEEEPEVSTEELAWIAYMLINSNIRMYDVLMGIFASLAGSEKAKQLQELHEDGNYLFPPSFLEPDES